MGNDGAEMSKAQLNHDSTQHNKTNVRFVMKLNLG